MNGILEKIVEENSDCLRDSKTLEHNYELFKRNLSKFEKKLLLRIVDEKDLMIEDAAFKNFKKGFCTGIQFAFEVFSNNTAEE